jgi:hypothetical protein
MIISIKRDYFLDSIIQLAFIMEKLSPPYRIQENPHHLLTYVNELAKTVLLSRSWVAEGNQEICKKESSYCEEYGHY